MEDIQKEMSAEIKERNGCKKRIISAGTSKIKHYKRRVVMTKKYNSIERIAHGWGKDLDAIKSKMAGVVTRSSISRLVTALYLLVPESSVSISRLGLTELFKSVLDDNKFGPTLSVMCKHLSAYNLIVIKNRLVTIDGSSLHNIEPTKLLEMIRVKELEYRKNLKKTEVTKTTPVVPVNPVKVKSISVPTTSTTLEVTITCKGTIEQIERFYNNLKLRG